MSAVTNKSVLITGSSGFIGGAFLRTIIPHKPSLIQLYDTQPLSKEMLELVEKQENIEMIQADIRDIESYAPYMKQVDILVHFAAQPSVPISTSHPFYDFDVNVAGSMKLLEYARNTGIEHFIFAASGGTIYGETDNIPTPEMERLNPISNYGASKAAFEMFLRSYASLYDMKTTSMRFGNIFGPGSTHGVTYDFFMKLRSNPEGLLILGDGTQTKSYLFIEDCIDGFLKALARENDGFEEFNLSGNEPVSVTQLAEIVSKTLGISPEFKYTGSDRGWKGDVRLGGLDTTKIRGIGWKQLNSFEQGIVKYIDWLKSSYGWPH